MNLGRMPSLWPLPGTGAGRRATHASAVILTLVALSRFALLADGPWEQDEALFATAVVDFNVVDHRPHPPGFPGWILIGKLAHLLGADPFVGLQLASAVASVGSFLLLAGLLARLGLPGSVVLWGALLYTSLPGIWVHSGRAFSSTPGLFFLLLSLWCVWRTRSQPLAYLGWASFAWALAVRPQLLVFAPLWLLVTLPLRWWTTPHGWGPPALAALLLGGVVGWMVVDTGGLDALTVAAAAHGGNHFSAIRAVSLEGLADLGWVRGLGGLAPAFIWVITALFGAWSAWRAAGASVTGWLGCVVAAAAVTVVFVHDPYYPRYSLPLYLATLPLVVYGVAAITRRYAVAALAAMTALVAVTSVPVVWFMSRNPLPVVAGLRAIVQSSDDARVLHSPGTFSFVRWEAYAGRLKGERIEADWERTRSRFIARLGDSDLPVVWLKPDEGWRPVPGITVRRQAFAVVDRGVWELSQRRFLRVELLEHAPLWLYGHDEPVWPASGRPWASLAPRAAVWLPPGSRALRLSLEIPQGLRASQAIVISRDERELLRRDLPDAQAHVAVNVGDCARSCILELDFARFQIDPANGAQVAARMEAVWPVGFPAEPYTLYPGEPRNAAAFGVRLQGFRGQASLGEPGRRAAWADSRARVDMPGTAGRVRIVITRPGRSVRRMSLRSDVESRTCPVGPEPRTCEVRVRGEGGDVWVEIESSSFEGRADPRSGVIVHEISFRPDHRND